MYEFMFDRSRWTLPDVLSAQARRHGGKTMVVSIDEGSMTYAQAHDDAGRVAGHLHGLGVQPGDRVVVMVPNGLDFIRIWTGLARLGAVMVAINTGLSGAILQSQVVRSRAALAIVGGHCREPFAEVLSQTPDIATILDVDGGFARPDGPRVLPFADWRGAEPYEGPAPAPADLACILYTSGTSGPSKGVLMPHAHCYLYALGIVESNEMVPDDRMYDVLPLYHVNGLLMQVYGPILAGASVVVRQKFSASNWLDEIIEHGATMTVVVGAIMPFVFSRPESSRDRQHKLRLVMPGPNMPQHEIVWKTRFGIPEVVSSYGMTECNMPLWEKVGQSRPGSNGKVYAPYFDVRIVDPDTDRFLGPDEVGEIVVRPNEPNGFMAGYDGMPEKTVEAWRNLWFHTGDAGRIDEDGYVFFIDRLKDRIRRRGENVSSFEIEEALERLPAVKEVAAFAVGSDIDDGEDEIMVAVVLHPGRTMTLPEIARHAESTLPRFCRPRYFELIEALPRTKTEKIQRAVLRERGRGPQTYDALAPTPLAMAAGQ